MTTDSQPTTIAEALAVVERWRADEDGRRIAELGEVAQEMNGLQAAMENLRQQLEALQAFRAELESKGEDLAALATQRAYQSIFEVLQLQAAALEQRERELQEAARRAAAELPARIAAAGLGEMLSEVEQFRASVEPTLHLLPASYRTAMLDVHKSQLAQLERVVQQVASAPTQAGAPVSVDIAYAIDVVDGAPELAVVVVPVGDAVQSAWIEREDGLQSWLAARVAQALYQASAEVGFLGAQALSGGHMGLLAVELELVGADLRIVDALRRQLGEIGRAPEIVAANVKVVAKEISMDQLLPPEEEEGGDGE